MTRLSIFGAAYTLLAVVLFAAAAQAGPAIESRCEELGAACVCSETLNADAVQTGNSGPYALVGSTNPSAMKPCREYAVNNSVLTIRSFGQLDVVTSGLDLPSGASGVTKVWKSTQSTGIQHFAAGHSLSQHPGRNPRMCARWYFYFEPGADTTCNNKMYDFKTTGTITTSGQILDGKGVYSGDRFHTKVFRANGCSDHSISTCSSEIHPEISDTLSGGMGGLDDCVGNWCRKEVCLSANDVPEDMGNLRIQSYVEVVDSNPLKRYDSTSAPGALGDLNSPGGLEWLWVPNMWRPSSGGGVCPGTDEGRRISHLVVASWPTDEGQFIGPSHEMEGGGSPSPPPPPPPPPPPAAVAPDPPVLLP